MFEKLMEYQSEDRKLKAIEDELRGSEEFKKYAKATKFLKTVNESKAQIEDRAKSLLSAMDDLTEKYNKLVEEKGEFDEATNAEEESTVAFLKKKSQELAAQFSSLESELDSLKKNMDELLRQYKKLSANTKEMMAVRDENKKKYEELLKAKEAEKSAITKKLDDIAKDVPPEYMAKYKEKRKDNKFPIVYEVVIAKDTHCSACGTELSKLQVSQLQKDKMIECENCRRLIFIKE